MQWRNTCGLINFIQQREISFIEFLSLRQHSWKASVMHLDFKLCLISLDFAILSMTSQYGRFALHRTMLHTWISPSHTYSCIILHLFISIALLTAWAFQKRSRPQQLTVCWSLHAKALQATASEGLAHGPYMVARAGFEPATLRSKGIDSINVPPRPTYLSVLNNSSKQSTYPTLRMNHQARSICPELQPCCPWSVLHEIRCWGDKVCL